MRAAGTAVGPRRDVDAPRQDDDRVIERVEPHQPGERLDPLPELLVALAGGAEPAERQVVGLDARSRFTVATDDRPVSSFTNASSSSSPFAARASSFGQGHLGLVVPWSVQPQHGLGRLDRRVVEQTLVDVADLEDRQGPEAELAGRRRSAARQLHLEHLEGFQQVQDGAVIDRDRLAGRVLPTRPELAPFEEREPVGVEQFALVGGELEPLVLDAAVDRPEGRQQAAPRIVAAFQHLLAEVGRRDPQLLPQGRDGVVLVVKLVAQQQQIPLLGAEQEHQPHHDRQGGFVELVLGHALEQRPAAVPVRPVDRLDEHLDRLAHLIAKLVGDFLLVLGALSQQPFERFLLGHAEEPVAAQQGAERLEGLRLLQPERGEP